MTNLLQRLLPAIILLFCSFIAAQSQTVIQGKISNRMGSPIAAAEILLLNPQTDALLSSCQSDSLGNYQLQPAGADNFKMTVSATWYQTEVRRIDLDKGGQLRVDFVLEENRNTLENITVSSRRPLIERKTDRLIFHVANSINTAGGNALDVISKSPGVQLNPQYHAINLVGKGSVNVLINGSLLQLSGEDLFAYLETIPAENIQQVEVITTPPSQYEAAGSAGLINIVLKKNRMAGLSGLVHAAYQQAFYGTATAGGSVNFHKEKLNVFATLNLSNGAKNQVERLNTQFAAQEYRLTDPYIKNVQNGQFSASLVYQLRPSGTLSLNYTSSVYQRKDNVANYTTVIQSNTGIVDSTLFTGGTALQHQNTQLINARYEWAIDTSGKKLSFSANRLWYDSDRSRITHSENFKGSFQSPSGFFTANKAGSDNQISITTAQADLALPYTWSTISLGGKISHIWQRSENRFYTKQAGTYLEDPGVSNAFDYTENVGALYVSVQKNIEKFGLQAGIRMESTGTEGISRTMSRKNKHNFTDFFATLMASYQPQEDQIWTLSYSKRMVRPGYADLDPFRLYFTPVSYAEGNPFLQPAFSHEAALALTLHGKYTFQSYYQYEKNHFGLVFGTDTATKSTFIRHENYSDNQGAGLGIVASFQPFSFWELQSQVFGNLNQVRTFKNFGQQQILTLPSYYVSLNNAVSLNKKGTILTEVNAYLVGRYQWEVSELEPTGSVDTGFKALLLAKRLMLSLSATDLFRTSGARSRNQITGQTMSSYFDQQSLRLAVSFKMGGNSREPRQKETGIEEEQKRM